jgi:hypothetical protein
MAGECSKCDKDEKNNTVVRRYEGKRPLGRVDLGTDGRIIKVNVNNVSLFLTTYHTIA